MAVMVTFTLNSDVETYRGRHEQMLGLAMPAGLLFHSAFEDGSQVGIVDFWPSAEAWQSFAEGPLAEGMKAGGIAPPDDLTIIPVLGAESR
jgi:hypothetical protein